MKFSTKDRYALLLMVELASATPGEYLPLKAVSDNQGISVKYLEQIVAPLSKAGLVESLSLIHISEPTAARAATGSAALPPRSLRAISCAQWRARLSLFPALPLPQKAAPTAPSARPWAFGKG